MLSAKALRATYVLPLRRDRSDASDDAELAAYLAGLSPHLELIVVDASPEPLYSTHTQLWADTVKQIPPAPELRCANGKVWGVLTGLAAASQEALVIADEDVRYELPQLRRLIGALAEADVVRPQNYFSPLPWHARWDTARSLINRATGGDWPGTLAVRRSRL
nr:glycosyltransferase family 2 protein [Candidatus Dormibacteraeota bacterium]